MSRQQSLPIDVERVAKRSTSRLVRRPTGDELVAGGFDAIGDYIAAVNRALDRAGVKPGDSFYVHRVPPPDRRSHLGDLQSLPGSKALERRDVLEGFLRSGPATAREVCDRWAINGGWRRCSELVEGGYLAPTGETRESTPGHPARVLTITERGRAALESST